MDIIITKGKNRNTLTCKRSDGSVTSENLGPDIPNHDIAHFVIEKKFKMTDGFYGNIQSGMSIAELSNKEIIKNLGPQTWLSEIMTRNLQSVSSGAAKVDQYIELVRLEAKSIEGIQIPNMSLTDVEEIKSDFDNLCKEWKIISENGQLNLKF